MSLVGETNYLSTVTNHTETLPVTINIIAKGRDGMLLELVTSLTEQGLHRFSELQIRGLVRWMEERSF